MEDFIFDGYRDGFMFLNSINNKSSYVDFSNYSFCYKFSNEIISGYYPKFNISNGRILTVCGSGDQVLSAVLFGAKDIDCFDSNCISYYNLMLKIYSIKFLDYESFLDFFGISGRCVDKKDIYNSFRLNINNKNVRYFFDIVFDDEIGISKLYNTDYENVQDLFYNIPYLNSNNYYKLRNIIDNCNITFKQSDLFNVFNFFNGTYDFINYSNIFDYVENSVEFCLFIKDTILNHLNHDGGIMINYSWLMPHYSSSINSTAQFIGADQTRISSCKSNNSIMYCGRIKN